MKTTTKPSSAVRFMSVIGASFGLTVVMHAAPIEHVYLDGLAMPKRWLPAECELSVSTHKVWDHPALMMRIPVDYSKGEKQYPVGWPRMYLNLQPEEKTWNEYDRLEFQIFTEFSRPVLPKRPLVFHVYDHQGQKKLTYLEMATIGEWRTVQINISDLGFTGTVSRLGFNINESAYKDKDMVAFHLGGFRLARATDISVTELNAVGPAIFCDSRALPLEMVVDGPVAKLDAGVPLKLVGEDNRVLNHKAAVTRGRQTVSIPLEGASWNPGRYSVTVFPDDPERQKSVAVTLATSPWRE